jgi:hypothetical protein
VRVLIINRWADEFADYGRHIDHDRHQVAYVTTVEHLPMAPSGAAHVEVIADLGEAGAVLAAADRCLRDTGGFDRVLALSEFDLLTAAEVREKFAVPGPGVGATHKVRDKIAMKRAVAGAGLRIPRFRAVESVRDAQDFADGLAGDVVVKPRGGAASQGCYVIDKGTPVAAARPPGTDLTNHEAEEFVTGPIWHVDGLLHSGEAVFAAPSRYVNTCYDFARGVPLGSVIQRGDRADRITDFALKCLRAMGIRDGAFHLEVIENRDGPAFLEVGARVGGGEIPFVLRDVYGVDLVGDWIRIELGESPRTSVTRPVGDVAGFLMVPEAVGQRLVARSSVLGTVPELYAEVLPPVGHVFDGEGGYDRILGRFRFRGPNSAAVEQAIQQTLRRYDYVLEPR